MASLAISAFDVAAVGVSSETVRAGKSLVNSLPNSPVMGMFKKGVFSGRPGATVPPLDGAVGVGTKTRGVVGGVALG